MSSKSNENIDLLDAFHSQGYYLHVDPPGLGPKIVFFRPPEYGPEPDRLLPSLT